MKKKAIRFGALLCVAVSLFAAGAGDAAEAPPAALPPPEELRNLGVFGDWVAYAYPSEAGEVCALTSRPIESRPEEAARNDVFFIITRHPKGTEPRYDIAARAGFVFARDASPELRIGRRAFIFFTGASEAGEMAQWAWPTGLSDIPKLLIAMKRGTEMFLSARREDETPVIDRYSLKGVTSGIKAIETACL